MQGFHFDEAGRIVIENYAARGPFASFLPGIAGMMGIPMWVFYVNRGQAIASFGVESKDCPIMEFQPANKAYQSVSYTGFRTFIKIGKAAPRPAFYEPFAPAHAAQMHIGANELELQETSQDNNLRVTVHYFTLPGEPFAGLVRQLTITNLDVAPIDLEVLDGLAVVIPYGVTETLLKEMNRTLEAWMEVFNLDKGIPFYRLRSSVADAVEIAGIQAGHFYLCFSEDADRPGLLPAFVDPVVVFGQNTALNRPDGFIEHELTVLEQARQISLGRTPCGFFGLKKALAPGGSLTLYGIVGHTAEIEAINRDLNRLTKAAYVETKRQEAIQLARDLTAVVETQTGEPLFDAYCRQNFLDNVMRGGWPVILGGEQKRFVYHLYSRKHGDLERDYNAFFLAAEHYSQGNGNFRDVNQNRRSDVLLKPQVDDFNVVAFMNLIQADGYNPLVIQGSQFYIAPENLPPLDSLVEAPDRLAAFLAKPFSPGQLLKYLNQHQVALKVPPEALIEALLDCAEQRFVAVWGEGYWVDHWTYTLDLIETYLAVYPDRKTDLLFGSPIYAFYESAAVVRPRADKYVLVNGRVRQFHAIYEDQEKERLLASHQDHQARAQHGQGEVYRTTLLSKLICLALVKFATLDPWGMGIEMEAGRPGWYDALNGLPGLLGSSIPETYELSRLLAFILAALDEHDKHTVALPVEVHHLLTQVTAQVETYNRSTSENRDFGYWDSVATLRERYRAAIRLGFDGAAETLTPALLMPILALFQDKVQAGIARAEALNNGLPPTYFTYTAEDYELQKEADGQPRLDPDGRPYVTPRRFKAEVLPLFLEGPVRALRIAPPDEAQRLHRQIKASALFDRKLQTYRVNTSLQNQPIDIGRARAFPPGWLENESIWLHMTYKYLLSMLHAGLYEAFYEDFKNALVPFLDPAIYGRSPLENSSFLVSSAHPDESLHGRGFVARLSGSTAEFISIWNIMMAGRQPFVLHNGALHLAFNPVLPGWLFDQNQTITFTFLGQCTVVYHNPAQRDTFGPEAARPVGITVTDDGQAITLTGAVIGAPYAASVREGRIKRIEITLG